MKKLFALLLALMLACTLLVACSPDDDNPSGTGNGGVDDKDSTLSEGSDPAASDKNWPEGLF